jgi:polysaccharide export outer membrane protein
MKTRTMSHTPDLNRNRLAHRFAPLLLLVSLSGCSSIPEIPYINEAPVVQVSPSAPSGSLPPSTSGAAPAAVAMPSATPNRWGDNIERVAVIDPAYLIGPEDALEISVWKDETLKGAALVRPDGGISFPLAGDFIVAGKTADQVRQELVKRLEKFIPEPVVTVAVVRVSSYHIYVLGRVNRPGDLLVGRNIDVLQALTLAGGMTPFASEDGIRIIRKVDGKSISIPFQYSKVRKSGDLSQNITLKSGDVLLVP